ncbi:MAG TPA: GlsB/YeaQ/YmgE family stress response membrane protein [Pyrinomonadaceae bacterium]
MFSILGTIIIGLIVGVIARFLLPGSENFPSGALGIILTIVLGIAGAFVGTFIGGALWGGENYAAGWIMSIIGAVVLLLLARLLFGRSGATTAP